MIFLLLGTFVAMTTVDVTKTIFYQLANLYYQVKQGVTFNFLFFYKAEEVFNAAILSHGELLKKKAELPPKV